MMNSVRSMSDTSHALASFGDEGLIYDELSLDLNKDIIESILNSKLTQATL